MFLFTILILTYYVLFYRNLCDINQEGKLNPEQFALAMWLINRKQSGKDPPAALTPDMVPPSMRPKGQDAVGIKCHPCIKKGGCWIIRLIGHFYIPCRIICRELDKVMSTIIQS